MYDINDKTGGIEANVKFLEEALGHKPTPEDLKFAIESTQSPLGESWGALKCISNWKETTLPAGAVETEKKDPFTNLPKI